MSSPSFALFRDPASLPASFSRPVLAIGNFDGVHRGHAALIARARQLAAGFGVRSGVLTFTPHPRRVLAPDRPFFPLAPETDKARLLARAGLDGLVSWTFDKALMGLTPEAFARDLLAGRLGVSGVVVGENFRYGSGRAGTVATLVADGERFGFAVSAVPPVTHDGEVVSSSSIRRLLAEGDVAAAARQLGHWWFARGPVRHGDKRGRLLGFPTANLVLDPGVRLAHGIYAVRVHVGEEVHDGVASFGSRPTFDDGAPRLESFIFDFDRQIYDIEIGVELVAWIRPELKFDSVEDLIARMRSDCDLARQALAKARLVDGVVSAV
jgi:riboflavin kinase/FMN adenylyltransferase